MTALRHGLTTGTCAAAASKAAAMCLCNKDVPEEIEVGLPDGSRVKIACLYFEAGAARAAVRKDAGDDPDITNGATIVATLSFQDEEGITLEAGQGVGRVTRPGLSVPPGQPAINPVPRQMIRAAIREVTQRPVKVILSIPGGEELAAKTFNPRLGVVGGLSILGTTGRVRPYSCSAFKESLKCSLDVALACGLVNPVLVPGNIGERAARRHFRLSPQQVIELGNEWGTLLDLARGYPFRRLLVVGHPGKLAKLVAGQWDTHSARSNSAAGLVARLGEEVLGHPVPESPTVEGLLTSLPAAERAGLSNVLAGRVQQAVSRRVKEQFEVTCVLVNLAGDLLGSSGGLEPWQ